MLSEIRHKIIKKIGVSRQVLLLIAGCIWIIAGTNILRIGLLTWRDNELSWLLKTGEAVAICLIFFYFVFRRLFHKHRKRIEQKTEKNCPFSFFDAKGWIIMVFMMTFGIVARKFNLLPISFISVFYSGLSVALIATGFLFLLQGFRLHRQHK